MEIRVTNEVSTEERPQLRELAASRQPGLPILVFGVVALLGAAVLFFIGGRAGSGIAGHASFRPVGAICVLLAGAAAGGLTAVAPRRARVVQLFGRYLGPI